jgi:multidrug efflux pump subunit AcrA (membrane-fusion protein)
MKSKIAYFSILAVLAVSVVASAEDYPLVKVVATEKGEGLYLTGHIIPQDGALSIESARFQGRVLSILKKEGEVVAEGTPLLLVSSSEGTSMLQELEIAKKKNSEEFIKAVGERLNQLGVKIDGQKIYIVATQGGVITKRFVEIGSIFNLGDPLVNILQPSRLGVEFDVPEYEISKVSVGQTIRITTVSDEHKEYTAEIETIIPTIDPASRSIKARTTPVRLPLGTALDTLAYGKLDTAAGALLLRVPTTALLFGRDHPFVIKRIKADYRAVPVEIVDEEENNSTIRPVDGEGLFPGDRVVLSNGIFLYHQMTAK